MKKTLGIPYMPVSSRGLYDRHKDEMFVFNRVKTRLVCNVFNLCQLFFGSLNFGGLSAFRSLLSLSLERNSRHNNGYNKSYAISLTKSGISSTFRVSHFASFHEQACNERANDSSFHCFIQNIWIFIIYNMCEWYS
jgi:hypothetical protein